jgi:hypothetical protein
MCYSTRLLPSTFGINPARQALTELILSEKVEDVDIENPKKTGKKGRPYAGVVRTRRETS